MAQSIKFCWWKTYSSRGELVQHKKCCTIPRVPGRHACVVKNETDDKEGSSSLFVDVERTEGGWVVQPYFPPETYFGEDGYTITSEIPEHWGHKWLVMDDQPEEVWSWLEFNDSTPGFLPWRYQLAITDGRRVPTSCGPQIDPCFRQGVDDLTEVKQNTAKVFVLYHFVEQEAWSSSMTIDGIFRSQEGAEKSLAEIAQKKGVEIERQKGLFLIKGRPYFVKEYDLQG